MSEVKMSVREKKVLNKFDYSKGVIKQAEDENTQVGIHAMNIFNDVLELRYKYAIEKHNQTGTTNEVKLPWEEGFVMFTNEEINAVVSMCFTLAENLRIGCDIDLQARLEQLQKTLDGTAPSIIKPSANSLKDVTLREEIHGLHDQ